MEDFSEFERLKIDQNRPIMVSTSNQYIASFYSLLGNKIDTRILHTPFNPSQGFMGGEYEVLLIDGEEVIPRSFPKLNMPISYLTKDSVIYFPGNDMHGDPTSMMFDSTHPGSGLKKEYLFKYERKIFGEPIYDGNHCPILPPDGKEVLPALIRRVATNNGQPKVLFEEKPKNYHYVIDKDGSVRVAEL